IFEKEKKISRWQQQYRLEVEVDFTPAAEEKTPPVEEITPSSTEAKKEEIKWKISSIDEFIKNSLESLSERLDDGGEEDA
ncbi:MAG: hypothetical protein ABRQ39_32515, partial [Candidatus Eremiobacterota bacterium]